MNQSNECVFTSRFRFEEYYLDNVSPFLYFYVKTLCYLNIYCFSYLICWFYIYSIMRKLEQIRTHCNIIGYSFCYTSIYDGIVFALEYLLLNM